MRKKSPRPILALNTVVAESADLAEIKRLATEVAKTSFVVTGDVDFDIVEANQALANLISALGIKTHDCKRREKLVNEWIKVPNHGVLCFAWNASASDAQVVVVHSYLPEDDCYKDSTGRKWFNVRRLTKQEASAFVNHAL